MTDDLRYHRLACMWLPKWMRVLRQWGAYREQIIIFLWANHYYELLLEEMKNRARP